MTESQRKNAESQRKTPNREKVMSDLWTIRLYHSLKKHSAAVATIDDVIAMLKEQEPVEPFHECTDGSHPYTLVSNKHFVFCPTCGRRIKWD